MASPQTTADFYPDETPDFIPDAAPQSAASSEKPPEQDGVVSTLGRSVKSLGENLNPINIGKGIYHAFADPTTPEEMEESRGLDRFPGVTGISRLAAKPIATAVDWYKGAAEGKVPIPYEQALSVAPEAMGTGAAAVLGPKILQEGPSYLGKAADLVADSAPRLKAAATAPVRLAARAGETALNQKVAPIRPLFRIMTPADEAEAVHLKVPGRDFGLRKPVYPGARFPEAPPPEVGQARGLGGYTSPDAPSSGLGKLPVKPAAAPEPAAAPVPIARPAIGKKLDTSLREAVGNKPVQPGIKIRDQFKTEAPPATEGHTPVESTAVKSFKYDPAAKELHVTTKNGTTYVSGEVAPEQAEMFSKASSKGQAWKSIRDNSPLVAKIIDGKRVAVKPTDFRSVGPDAPVPGEDLTPILRRSLKKVKAGN